MVKLLKKLMTVSLIFNKLMTENIYDRNLIPIICITDNVPITWSGKRGFLQWLHMEFSSENLGA